MSKKEVDATGFNAQEKRFPMGGEASNPFQIEEIDPLAEDPQMVEPVVGSPKDAVELEAFMNEMVLIRISERQHENDVPVAFVSVNGVNHPIPRGVPTWVKRHYVEALEHSRTKAYDLQLTDPQDPSKRELVERPMKSFPYMVLEDRNPRGRAWLDSLMRQAG